MTAQTLIWTALPNGADRDGLKVTTFVSPRLDAGHADAILYELDIGRSWPDIITSAAFEARFWNEDGTTQVATATASVRSQIDPSLWQSLFPYWTPVANHRFQDINAGSLWSFDALALQRVMTSLYASIAADPVSSRQTPSILLDDPLGRTIDSVGHAVETLRLLSASPPPSDPEALLAALTPEERAVLDFEMFFHRYRTYGPPAPAPRTSPFEFHEVLALLGDFPFLLRGLGFVVDLTIPRSANIPSTGAIQIVPSWTSNAPEPGTASISPRTQYNLRESTYFRAAEKLDASGQITGDTQDGMLRLNGPAYAVIQGELDGSASKLVDFCTNMRPARHTCYSHLPTTAALPSLLAGGFTVLRTGRAAALRPILKQSLAHNTAFTGSSGSSDALYADDLVRGYRVDVERNLDNRWRSLHQRTGTVTLDEFTVPTPPGDEGYVKAVTATVRSSGASDELSHIRVHEAVFGWEGWSLSAKRPGRTIVDPTDTAHATPTHVSDSPIPSASRDSDAQIVSTDLRAMPGTLPRLRYGDTYRIRARAVDLAGNSLTLAEGDPSFAAPPQRYLRFEPVASPVLLQRAPVIEGESLEHLVIRSPDSFDLPSTSTCERHVAPPKTTQATAELHGMLDLRNPDAAYTLSLRESGTFLDRVAYDANGPLVPVTNIQLVSPPGVPAVFPANRGDALKPGQYVIHTGDTVRVPYLADPFAAGISLRGLHGNVTRTFDGAWPDVRAFRIQLVDGKDTSQVVSLGSGESPLILSLARGTMATLAISSTLSPANLDVMWAWSLLSADEQEASAGAAVSGLHWMLTPSRTITLVNAVKKPIVGPSVKSVTLARPQGSTHVDYTHVEMDLHAPSTGQVDVEAAWTDLLDSDAGPKAVAQAGHAFTVTVAYDDSGVFPSPPAVAGPRAPYPDAICISPPIPAPSRVLRQELGDTKHRVVTLTATGTTRYREYFPASSAADGSSDAADMQRAGPPLQQVHIPSSAEPAAPVVAYILPTFAWDAKRATERRRIGGGLRVYLERPWFSSGEGELLAVVVAAPNSTVSEANRKYVSEWGLDPMWSPPNDGSVPAQMTPAHVVKSDPTQRTESPPLLLAEEPSLRVVAVGLPVRWSPERNLWYCDIELDPGLAYFPFVRLALARYQPYSIPHDAPPGVDPADVPGVELSRVVRADFAQLTANRTATVGLNIDKTVARVAVNGPSAMNALGQSIGASPPAWAGHDVQVHVETRPRGASDLAWQRMPATGLSALVTRDGTTTWYGEVPLPAGFAADPTTDYRLMLIEYETFRGDADVTGVTSVARVVYADTFPLST